MISEKHNYPFKDLIRKSLQTLPDHSEKCLVYCRPTGAIIKLLCKELQCSPNAEQNALEFLTQLRENYLNPFLGTPRYYTAGALLFIALKETGEGVTLQILSKIIDPQHPHPQALSKIIKKLLFYRDGGTDLDWKLKNARRNCPFRMKVGRKFKYGGCIYPFKCGNGSICTLYPYNHKWRCEICKSEKPSSSVYFSRKLFSRKIAPLFSSYWTEKLLCVICFQALLNVKYKHLERFRSEEDRAKWLSLSNQLGAWRRID